MPEIQAGRVLSHYRLVEKIGEGGMGVVWKALDTKLGRPVALKFLPAELTADPERRRRFLREARTASAVTHPNIVTIHEVDEVDGTTFLCMELVEGRTLRAALGRRPLPIADALRVATEIAEGLARAHRDGIVHRDLKPENVMLGADGHAKILDFGLAKLAERRQEALRSQIRQDQALTTEMTGEGMVLGTAAYMSPEQARGEAVDTRSDIFSFGVLLYEMVTGRVPFQGHSQIETLASILHEPAPPASRLSAEVPARLDEILGKCLEKDPGGRYQSSQDLVVDLKRMGRDLQSGVAQSREGIHDARTPTRRPWQLAVLGGVAVLLVAGTLFVLRPGREALPPVQPAHARSEIAVLPFENLSAEPSQAYFAGGLHDELLTQLSKVAALKVISRTSVMGYEGTTKPLKVIADELGVGSVVEGSVQVVGGRLRVNVQLIDATTDQHLWAERYDRTLDDAFAIQDEVAQQIVAAVGAALTESEMGRLTSGSTTNPEAYRLYLQGREYWLRPGFERKNLEIAEQLYGRAIALDSNFAIAHAALSEVHGWLYFNRSDPSMARAKRQREEAETALRLVPDLPQAHVAMGQVYYRVHQDYRRALAEFELALKGMPNDGPLWLVLGATHRRLGNWDETLVTFERAARIDPRNANIIGDLGGWTYDVLHRYPEAVEKYDQALSLAPDWHGVALWRGEAYVRWHGQLDTLRATLSHVPMDMEWFTNRAEALLLGRDHHSLLQVLGSAQGRIFYEVYFRTGALYAGWAYQMRGDRPAARAAFGSALAVVDSTMKELPEDWRLHAARGLALAGLDRRDEAVREASRLQGSVAYRGDAAQAVFVAEERARILVQAGDADDALDEIERLLVGPSLLSVHTLRLDPRWDPIRGHPRFKALLAKYGSERVLR